MVHSGAARAAVENMMRTLSIEWARFGISPARSPPGQFDTETLRTKYPQEVVENVARTVPLGRARHARGDGLAGRLPRLARGRLLLRHGDHDRRRPRQLVRPLAAGGVAGEAGEPLAEERRPKELTRTPEAATERDLRGSRMTSGISRPALRAW